MARLHEQLRQMEARAPEALRSLVARVDLDQLLALILGYRTENDPNPGASAWLMSGVLDNLAEELRRHAEAPEERAHALGAEELRYRFFYYRVHEHEHAGAHERPTLAEMEARAPERLKALISRVDLDQMLA